LEASEYREPAAIAGTAPSLSGGDVIIAARSPWQLFWRKFREDKLAMASLVFLALIVIMAIAAPLVVQIAGAPGPNATDQNSLDPVFATATGPSSAHIFGVDQIGRDVFSRVVYGARISLLVAVIATFLATSFGVVMGLLAGYFRGWVDTLISRTVDVLLAIPYLMLAIGLASACSLAIGGSGSSSNPGCLGGLIKPGLTVVIFVIAFTSWTYMARIIRGQVLSIREKEFVEAARAQGASHGRIIFREILPNLTAPIVVYSSILVPQVILYEAALSYLGVGVQPPTASWGQMISDYTTHDLSAWWYLLFPGLALLFTVLAFNLVGDAMQDALNPRASKT
jgi:ABC-type dipeptide/oligopeptide/nickel transport system permease subunit